MTELSKLTGTFRIGSCGHLSSTFSHSCVGPDACSHVRYTHVSFYIQAIGATVAFSTGLS